MQPYEIRTLRVGMLGTNCYLVSRNDRNDAVVIDPGADAQRILDALKGKRIAAILLTHGHFDHIGGVNGLFRDDTELVIHPLDAPMLTDPALNVSWMIGQDVTAPRATRLVREGDAVEFAGMTFTVLHTPGHTPGSVCYRLDDVMFTGDTVMGLGYGRTDLPGGSDEEMETSLNRLMPMRQECRFLGGHG